MSSENDSPKKKNLFREFPPVSREEWEQVIARDLKGADYKEKLRWETGEGPQPLPFYRREDLERWDERRPVRSEGGWTIVQQLYTRDPSDANTEAREALDRGARGLRFRLEIETLAGMLGGDLSGLSLLEQSDMNTLLENIPLSPISLYFDSGLASPAVLAMLHNELERRGTEPGRTRISLLHDPFASLVERGHRPREGEPLTEFSGQLLSFGAEFGYDRLRCLGVDMRPYHHAGATILQELSFGLSAASEYLARLTESGFEAPQIARGIHFNIPVGSLYFLEIARIRALRILWRNLCSAYGIDKPPPAYIHAETSDWNKTLYDPYTNMLRGTTEGMSAALGGCDALTIHPYDRTFDRPDSFSKRISRNAQVIMQEESYLDRVADPSAGSYYIEKLTDDLAHRAWDQFREIEQQGGLLQSMRDGYMQSAVEASREERNRAIAYRDRVFVGTNRYPNTEERAGGRKPGKHATAALVPGDASYDIDQGRLIATMAEALDEGAGMGDLAAHLADAGRQEFATLTRYRGPELFEAVRRATEEHPRTPRVLTLPIGDRRMRKVRSSFAVNLLGCAGYEIEDPLGFDSAEEAVERLREYRPDVAVLCSSDEAYSQLVDTLCGEVGKWSERPVMVLAGQPEERFRDAGIDLFIHRRCNVLKILHELQVKLGVSTLERQER